MIKCDGFDDAIIGIAYSFGVYRVVYDKEKNRLIIVRDRAGEKPLYIISLNNHIAFSSDLITFKNFPEFSKEIATHSFSQYLRLSYIPSPGTIFTNCFKLPPSTILEINLNTFLPNLL